MRLAHVAQQIERMIASGDFCPGSRLPTLTALSRTLGASPATVLKALKGLKAKGLLDSVRGSCYSVARHDRSDQDPVGDIAGRRTSAEAIADQLREDVLADATGRPLPSAKELAARHGCSHRTLMAALASLVKEGIVRRRGTGYATAVPGTNPRGQAGVYFVGEQSFLESSSVLSFTMGMERELEAQRWGGLRFLTGDDPSRCVLPESHLVAAYVHLCDQKRSAWPTFLRRHPSVPSVLVNLHEVAGVDHSSRDNLITIMPDNRRAGREVSQHCAAKGHVRCAYFSELPIDEGCALLRLEGLSEVFRREPAKSKRTCRVFDSSRVATSADPQVTKLNQSIERAVDAALGSSGLSRAFIRDGFYSAYGVLHWWNRYTALRPIFEQAFADQSITAWVCASDPLAVLAHTFIVHKGATPGKEISLASFDNTRAAYALGITSYDFGFDVMGRTAAHCLAAPHLAPIDKSNTIHAAGQLVARVSTGQQ